MLCNVCHNKQSSVHFKHVSNNEVLEVHLCEECAHEKGINFFKMDDMPFGEEQFGLAELLAGFTDVPASLKEKKIARKCSNCGITYAEFKRSGRLGCSECYRAFNNQLIPLLKRLQGSVHHSGKVPAAKNKPVKVRKTKTTVELKEELKALIEREEYEKAALVRDRIRSIEKKNDRGEG